MARQADTGSSTGAPFAKLNRLGDTLIGAFAGGKNRQQQDYESKELKTKDDGSPLLEEIMHLVAMPGITAITGDVEDPHSIEPGTHVRFSVSSFKWRQVIEARKALPPYAGFAAGVSCSGDVYVIELAGWSAKAENPAVATARGYNVVEGRIVMRTQDEKDSYVLAQSRLGKNANPAKDLTITIRRPNADEKAWEQKADALFDLKPWENAGAGTPEPAMAGGGGRAYDDDEPF